MKLNFIANFNSKSHYIYIDKKGIKIQLILKWIKSAEYSKNKYSRALTENLWLELARIQIFEHTLGFPIKSLTMPKYCWLPRNILTNVEQLGNHVRPTRVATLGCTQVATCGFCCYDSHCVWKQYLKAEWFCGEKRTKTEGLWEGATCHCGQPSNHHISSLFNLNL